MSKLSRLRIYAFLVNVKHQSVLMPTATGLHSSMQAFRRPGGAMDYTVASMPSKVQVAPLDCTIEHLPSEDQVVPWTE